MRTFVVDRTRWARGGRNGTPTIVPNDGGNMCCLGFVREQSGISVASCRGRLDICQVGRYISGKLPAGLVLYSLPYRPEYLRATGILNNKGAALQSTNDDPGPDAQREAKLNELAAQGPEPFRFVFVDGPEEYARALAEAGQ